MAIFDATMSALQKSLELRMRAHEVHTSNIANANVPNFKAKRVDFDTRMQEALKSLETETPLINREKDTQQLVARVNPEIIEDPLARPNGDGNTVNIEKENVEIAKNTIAYEAAIQMIMSKFAMAKVALGEGGR